MAKYAGPDDIAETAGTGSPEGSTISMPSKRATPDWRARSCTYPDWIPYR